MNLPLFTKMANDAAAARPHDKDPQPGATSIHHNSRVSWGAPRGGFHEHLPGRALGANVPLPTTLTILPLLES